MLTNGWSLKVAQNLNRVLRSRTVAQNVVRSSRGVDIRGFKVVISLPTYRREKYFILDAAKVYGLLFFFTTTFRFADNVLGLGGVGGDGEDEYLAVVDGTDDFLAPHGGALDAGFVDPDSYTGLAESRH